MSFESGQVFSEMLAVVTAARLREARALESGDVFKKTGLDGLRVKIGGEGHAIGGVLRYGFDEESERLSSGAESLLQVVMLEWKQERPYRNREGRMLLSDYVSGRVEDEVLRRWVGGWEDGVRNSQVTMETNIEQALTFLGDVMCQLGEEQRDEVAVVGVLANEIVRRLVEWKLV